MSLIDAKGELIDKLVYIQSQTEFDQRKKGCLDTAYGGVGPLSG